LERAFNQIDGEIRAAASLMFLNSRHVNVFLFLHLLPQLRNPVFYKELAMGDLCCHEQFEQLKTIHQSSVLLHHHVRTSLSNMTSFPFNEAQKSHVLGVGILLAHTHKVHLQVEH